MQALNLVLAVVHLFTAIVVGLLAFPLARGRVSMNRSYGFRFRAAFESAESWDRINRFGGRHLLVCSALLGLFALAVPFIPLRASGGLAIVAVTAAPLILVVPAFTTWRYSRALQKTTSQSGA